MLTYIVDLRDAAIWHCLVKHLLSWRSSVERLVRPLEIIIVAEGSESARSAGCATGPGIVKPFNAHFQRLEPFFDRVAVNVVEITAQIGASQRGEIAEAIDQKVGV